MSAVNELFWRDEILQAMFWMRGEGLAERVTPADLARFLAADEPTITTALIGLAEDGYVEAHEGPSPASVADRPSSVVRRPSPAYRLTPLGIREGGRRFQDEFTGLTQQAHGECGPGCWCHDPDHEGEPCPNQPSEEPEHVRR